MLEQARTAAGLSQAELAAAAGISRQAVSAIEAGRHRPGIDAALALARAVGVGVETLFGAPGETVLVGDVPEGAPVTAARVADRLVCAPARRLLAADGWPRPDGVLEAGRVRALPGADLDGLLVVGCDPAIALAAGMLPAAGPRRVIALSGSSGAAVAALREGLAHAALVHAARPGRPPRGAERIALARWRVGVAQRARSPRPLADLCERRIRVVQREDGAASQQAFLAAVARVGAPPPLGPRAAGHLEVARRVAAGALAGVTMEPAAAHLGLSFEALEEHRCELWIGAEHRDHPGARSLVSLLGSSAFRRRLELVRGYEVAG